MRSPTMGLSGSVRTEGRSRLAASLVPLVIFATGIAHRLGEPGEQPPAGRRGMAAARAGCLQRAVLADPGQKLSAALLLFSGTFTGGFSTILALGLLSTYVGATFGAAASNVGVTDALLSIVLYAPSEFAGLLLAATAGIIPLAACVRSAFDDRSERSPYISHLAAVQPALRYLAYAVLLICIGAGVEAAVISGR
jgi:hypothetical protein